MLVPALNVFWRLKKRHSYGIFYIGKIYISNVNGTWVKSPPFIGTLAYFYMNFRIYSGVVSNFHKHVFDCHYLT